MGGNGGQSFYRRDELSVAKAIRSEMGSVYSFGFLQGEIAAALCTVCFPGHLSTLVVIVLIPLRRRSSFPLVLSDDPIPSKNNFPLC
jgi:hypothetical protein